MKYKILALDHDDTVVDSTRTIHFPSLIETLNVLRPDYRLSMEEYVEYCFEPGFYSFCYDILHFSEEEMNYQVDHWYSVVKSRIPKVFDGMKRIITKFKENGGKICVVSYSHKDYILRDYAANGLPLPDAVYGFEQPPEKRKPNVWPLVDMMGVFNVEPSEIIMVDDMKQGLEMAKKAGVDFVGVGWANDVKSVEEVMRSLSDYYCKTTEELESILFS